MAAVRHGRHTMHAGRASRRKYQARLQRLAEDVLSGEDTDELAGEWQALPRIIHEAAV